MFTEIPLWKFKALLLEISHLMEIRTIFLPIYRVKMTKSDSFEVFTLVIVSLKVHNW